MTWGNAKILIRDFGCTTTNACGGFQHYNISRGRLETVFHQSHPTFSAHHALGHGACQGWYLNWTHLNQTTVGMEKADKCVTEVSLLSVGFCLLGMHYAVYITFLWDDVPLDGRMSDPRFFLLRYPVKNAGKIFQTTHWQLNISWSNQDNVDQRPQLRCFRLEETAAMIIISVFLLEYASAS